MPPSPERAGKWLGLIWPVLERGSAPMALLLLVLGAVQVWYLLGQMSRLQTNNETLVHKLLEAQQQHVTLVEKYVHCAPPP